MMYKKFTVLLWTLFVLSPAWAQTTIQDVHGETVEIEDASRIVAVGGALTEMVYALGEENRLVGVDTTSQWPPAVLELPKVGYQRTLGAEGILSLRPSLILATEHAGPPATLDQLRAAGVTVLVLPAGPDLDAALRSLRSVAVAVDQKAQGEVLIEDLRRDLATVRAHSVPAGEKPSVVYVLGGSAGLPLVAGRDTAADTVIGLAGGRNAAADFSGYRPLGPESLTQMAPEVIVIAEHAAAEFGGVDKLLAQPAFAATPAGRNGRVIPMDALYLLGMGPRLADAVRDLARVLHAGPLTANTRR